MKLKLSKLVPQNPFEILLIVLLIIFILSPIEISPRIANSIDSTLGIIFFSVLIVYLFLFNHVALAILFVVAVFELIRRSSLNKQITPSVVTYTALQPTVQIAESQPKQQQMPQVQQSPQQNMAGPMNAALEGQQPMARQLGRSRELQGANPQYVQAGQAEYLDYMADQFQREDEMRKTNTRLMEMTLEEEITHKVPQPRIEQDYLDSSYQPVLDNIHQASPI